MSQKGLLLNEVVDGHDDRDRREENGGGVGDDEEGGHDPQQAGDRKPDHQRHRGVQHVHVFAEPDEGARQLNQWPDIHLHRWLEPRR